MGRWTSILLTGTLDLVEDPVAEVVRNECGKWRPAMGMAHFATQYINGFFTDRVETVPGISGSSFAMRGTSTARSRPTPRCTAKRITKQRSHGVE